jgi:hypothetical protein
VRAGDPLADRITLVGSSTHPAPTDTTKSPFRGSFCIWRRGWDMFGSSLSLTLRAARSGPAFGCQNSFPILRRQDAEANIALAMARRAKGGTPEVNPCGFVHAPCTNRYKKSPFRGSFCIWRRGWDMFGSSLSLTLRAARSGPACGCQNSFPMNFSNPCGFVHAPCTNRYKKSPFRGSFCIWRRGWDSNPRYAIHVRLISSQVHSTTLPPLRKWAANDTGSIAD